MCDQGDAVTAWETGADTDTDPEALAAIAEAERIFREGLVRGDVPFTVDAEPSNTVLEVKQKIEAEQRHPVAWQRIIYAQQQLADEAKIGDLNIAENGYLVIMVRQPRGAAAAPADLSSLELPVRATRWPHGPNRHD